MSRLTLVFITLFVDLIGFGIVLPLLPFYAQDFGATPTVVGLVVAVHPAAQFLLAPFWGRLSDRYGRRPILLIGLVGSALSYLVFGLATSLAWLFVSRIIAGTVGANVPVAQAYIADSTDLENRTRGMGLVGAAFGLGFVVGPAIGGALSQFGYGVAGFFAAGLSLTATALAFFFLPESLERSLREAHLSREAEAYSSGLAQRVRLAVRFARRPTLRQTMILFVLITFVFASFTTAFPLLLGREMGFAAREAGYLLAFVGLVMAIIQGRLIGPLANWVGERRLVVAGSTILVLGYAALPMASDLWMMGLALFLIGTGTALDWPSLNGLASQYAGADMQGGILGVMQSLSGLARVAGAVWAGWTFGEVGPGAPFFLSSLLMSLAAGLAVWFMIRAPEPPPERVEAGVGVPIYD